MMLAIAVGATVVLLTLLIPTALVARAFIFCFFSGATGLVVVFLLDIAGDLHGFQFRDTVLLSIVPSLLAGQMALAGLPRDFMEDEPKRRPPRPTIGM